MKKIKHKKLWFTLATIAAVVGVFVILCFTMFSLKTVTLDFRSTTNRLAGHQDEIIQSGKLPYGGSVLFMSKKGMTARLEKNNPYLKVVNIETIFPSSMVIHAVERLEVYALPVEGGYLICDEEFKVLRTEKGAYESAQDKPILLNGIKLSQPAEAGDFLPVKIPDIYSAFIESNRLLHEQKSLIKSIELETIYEEPPVAKEFLCAKFNMYNGQTYIIKDLSYGLRYKVAQMLIVYSDIFNIAGQPIKDSWSEVWTVDLLKNCVVTISSYYRSDLHDENECKIEIVPFSSAND